MLELHFSVIWSGQRAFVSSVEMLSTIEERRRRLLDVEDSTEASWNTHHAQRRSHGSVCIEKHTWGILQGMCTDTYAAQITQRGVRNKQMTVTHNELAYVRKISHRKLRADTYEKSITQKEIHKYNYAQTILPCKFQMRNHSFWK